MDTNTKGNRIFRTTLGSGREVAFQKLALELGRHGKLKGSIYKIQDVGVPIVAQRK